MCHRRTKVVQCQLKPCTLQGARHHASRTHTTHAHHTQLVRERQNPSIHDKTCTDPAQPLRALFSAAADLLQHQHGKTARSRKQWSTTTYATAVCSTNVLSLLPWLRKMTSHSRVSQACRKLIRKAQAQQPSSTKTTHQCALWQDTMGH